MVKQTKTLPCIVVISLLERHQVSHMEQVHGFSQDVTECTTARKPDESLKAHVHSPFILPVPCMSITTVTS